MVVGIIRRILGRDASQPVWDARAASDVTSGVGLGVTDDYADYDSVMANLEYKRMEIEQVKEMVAMEIKETYDAIVRSVKEGDRETAELLAAEVALKKNIVKALSLVSKLLKLAVTRIRTAKTTEEAVKALGPVVAVLRSVSPYLSNVSPELAVQIASIREEIERLYSMPGLQVQGLDTKGILDLVPEAKNVLRQAVREASEDVSKLLPEEPREASEVEVDIEEAAARLIEYIKANGGRLNVKKAAQELGLSPSLVRAALRHLEKRGLVKLAPRRPQGEALA
ncbi:MAG: MarR family transcriptional regulator [Desulfurococcales archaeon]|nr:MarR family transcriptional regulator [Desulfurococcales archaeon]